MKHISACALTCRHPMASGMLHILFGSMLYGTITYGRMILTGNLALVTLIGVAIEDRDLMEKGGDAYRRLAEVVPT